MPMDLRELIKLADSLDDSGKQELVCPYCKTHAAVRFGKYVVKTRAGEVKRQRYRCKSCRQAFKDLTNTSSAHEKTSCVGSFHCMHD